MARQRHPQDLDLDGLHRRRADAISSWFDGYADAVYGFVYYRVGNDPDLAADVAQETFVAALSRIEEYDANRGEMFPWLTYIARNCARKALRQNHRYSTTVIDLWKNVDRQVLEGIEQIEHSPLPSEVLERQELGELVRGALASLPPRYRRALEQRYFEESSLREIASNDGASEGAIKVLLHRARRAFHVAFTALVDGLEKTEAFR